MTQKLCNPESQVYHELVAFVNGGDLADQPALKPLVMKLRFIPTSEHFVEGMHAIVTNGTHVAPHHGPVHVGLLHHMRHILRRLDGESGESGFLSRLAKHCGCARRPCDAVHTLGLDRHPLVSRLKYRFPADHINRRFKAATLLIVWFCAVSDKCLGVLLRVFPVVWPTRC